MLLGPENEELPVVAECSDMVCDFPLPKQFWQLSSSFG